MNSTIETSEAAIFGRILSRENGRLSLELARYVLALDFSDEDKARMHELATRNQDGRLTGREKEELLGFANAGCLLGVLHSKARKTLRKRTAS